MTEIWRKASYVRLFALIAVLALVATACGTETPGGTDDPSATDDPSGTDAPPGGDLGTYTLGIFQDMTTDNYWNYLDVGSSVWNAYVLGPNLGSMYAIAYPGLDLQPDLAEGDLPDVTQEGDVWVGEMTLKEGLTWSDGEPLTAEDFVFTWQTAVDLELGTNWPGLVDADIVTSVEAVDDVTVRVTFNAAPGLGHWGPGSSVVTMPIFPEHFWADVVAEAAASDDPSTTLIAASGVGAPSSGPTMFDERQEGSFGATTANPNWWAAGTESSSGGVTWTEGPYADDFQFPLYGGQEAAVLALGNGEVDLLLNPLGMQRGFQDQVAENSELTAIVNPTNGYRFLAFNHTRAPMDDPAFRDALTALINKEFVTESLLQGVAFPLYVILPEGNTAWYNEEVATELETVGYAGLEDNERRQIAIDLLTDAGYTWETTPAVDAEGAFTPGAGLIDPDGAAVPQLEILTPTASYDPLRSTFGTYISGVAQEMGLPVVSIPTDFNKIIDIVFAAEDPDYDMFILGYSLGSPAFPTYHDAFFGTEGGSNNTGYSNADYDALAAAYNSSQTVEEALEHMWEMERLIAVDKPHIPLFDTGILEFYNNRVAYPFTDTLSGLQFIAGSQGSVQAR